MIRVRPRLIAALAVSAALVGGALAAQPAQAASPATIHGTITPSPSKSSPEVLAFSASGKKYVAHVSGSGSGYSLSVPAGSYKLLVDPSNNTYGRQWWKKGAAHGTSSFSSASTITVKAGASATANFSLVKGVHVKGTITLGSGVKNATVDVYGVDSQGIQLATYLYYVCESGCGGPGLGSIATAAYSKSKYTYDIAGFGPGTYKLTFESREPKTDALTNDVATTVTVVVGTKTVTKNVVLKKGGIVTGTVKAGSKALTTGGYVIAYNSKGVAVASGEVSTKGVFSVKPLPTGTYYLQARPYSGAYAPTYYGGKETRTGAKKISVTAGKSKAIGTFALLKGAAITGSVKVPGGHAYTGGGTVTAYKTSAPTVFVASARLTSSGSYTLPGLSSGTYYLQIQPSSASGWAPTFVGGKPTTSGATKVTVTIGKTKAAGAVTLIKGATLTGTVHGGGSVFTGGGSISVYTSKGAYAGSGTLGGDGAFQVKGLLPGAYVLSVYPYGSAYQETYYGGVTNSSTATKITLAVGQVLDLGTIDLIPYS